MSDLVWWCTKQKLSDRHLIRSQHLLGMTMEAEKQMDISRVGLGCTFLPQSRETSHLQAQATLNWCASDWFCGRCRFYSFFLAHSHTAGDLLLRNTHRLATKTALARGKRGGGRQQEESCTVCRVVQLCSSISGRLIATTGNVDWSDRSLRRN